MGNTPKTENICDSVRTLPDRKVIKMMRRRETFLVFLSLLRVAVFECPETCSCTGTSVDCSGQELNVSTIPRRFGNTITEIRLSNNKLSAIPNGLFDTLYHLRSVALDNNPWTCDCNILYLRSWLLKQEDRSPYKHLSCSSPAELQSRRILYLTEDEVVATCDDWYCPVVLICQIGLVVFIAIQAILLIFVIRFLRRFEALSEEAIRSSK